MAALSKSMADLADALSNGGGAGGTGSGGAGTSAGTRVLSDVRVVRLHKSDMVRMAEMKPPGSWNDTTYFYLKQSLSDLQAATRDGYELGPLITAAGFFGTTGYYGIHLYKYET